jgi:uroporphyrinogen-III decarboxylase
MTAMTSVERIHVTLGGGRPDRVPVVPKIWTDLAARLTNVSDRDVIENPELAMRVTIDAAVSVQADAARLFVFPARRTIEKDGTLLEVDDHGRYLGTIDRQGGWATQREDDGDFQLEDPAAIAFLGFRHYDGPLIRTVAEAASIAVPDRAFYEAAGYRDLLVQMRHYAGGRVACLGDCDTGTLAWLVRFRGLQQALMDLIEAPQLVHTIMARGAAYAIERGKLNLDAGLRILRVNDSVANMSLISPEQWKQFILPHFKTICSELHSYCRDARIYCHICGNVLPILELLEETGLDCIGPLDPLGGFTVADARRRVGEHTVLMGGVNTQALAQASAGDVKAEARRCIRAGVRQGGRYILGSGCMVPRSTPRENLLALVAAARSEAESA